MRQLLLYIILACGATVAAQTTTTIKLTQLETSPVIESSRAGQVGLTNSDGKQRYAQFVEVDLNPIGFVPTATGNTQNYSEFVTDPNGDKWYIDWQGRGYKFPGSSVDKNGYYGGNLGNGGNGTIPSSTTSTLTNQLTFLIDTSALTGTVPIRIKINKPGDFEDFLSMVSGSNDSLFFYRSDANFVIRYTSAGDFALVADSKLMLQGDSIQMVGIGTYTGGGSIFLKQTAGGIVKKQIGINATDLNFSPVLDINAGSNVTVTDTNGVYTISATGGGGGSTYYPGQGIVITNDTIAAVDTSMNNEGRLSLSSTIHGLTITSSTEISDGVYTQVSFNDQAGIYLDQTGDIINIYNTGDLSDENEGTLGVSAGAANTSVITSNTNNATGVTLSGGTGISVSETTSTNGGTITVTNSAPDQTVTLANGGGVAVSGSYPGFTLTATDQSITNELQTIDTFSLSGQSLRASLSSDNQPAKVVTLPVVGISAGTNVTVSESSGVYTINASGGGGGISGITNYIPKFNSSTTVDTSGLYWSTSGNLGIGTASPTSRLDIKGTAATDTVRIGPELLTTGTGAGWTGTSFATGYTHSTGTTALAANSLTITAGTYYMVTVTVTGRSAGTCTATVGGLTTGAIITNTTITVEGFATTTANFSVATTSTFNGNVTASLKILLPIQPIISLENSIGETVNQIIAGKKLDNVIIGRNAAPYITTSDQSVIIGSGAGNRLQAAGENVFLGYNAGARLTSNRVVIVGANASSTTTSVSSAVALGYGANLASGNSQIIIGSGTGLGAGTTLIGFSGTTRTVLQGSLVMGSTTATPNARIHTIGSGNVSGSYSLWATNSDNVAPGLCVTDGLNTGIGTSTPIQKLHVAGSAYITDSLNIGTTATGGRLVVYAPSTTNSLVCKGNGVDVLTVTGSNRVGVLDPTPDYMMDIEGACAVKYLYGQSATPTVTAYGTGATATVTGNNVAFTVTYNTGTTPLTTGILFRVSLDGNYGNIPVVVFSPGTGNSGRNAKKIAMDCNTEAASVTVDLNWTPLHGDLTLPANTDLTFNFHIIGK